MSHSHYHYYLYGLHMTTPLQLPALAAATDTGAPADVTLHIDTFDFPPHELDDDGFALVRDGASIYLHWRDVGRFRVHDGREIHIQPADGVTDEVLRLFIQGTTLAMLLYQRGLFVLHASAVAVDGQVVVFMGDKGAGKSTTAAALCQRGHSLVADDIVVIDLSDPKRPMVIPGYPQIKLWTESVEALGQSVDGYARLRADTDKYAWVAGESFHLEPLPLSRIYVLSVGDAVNVQPVPGGPATMLLLRFVYASRFGSALVSRERWAQHMQEATHLAPTLRLLLRPQDVSRLADLSAAIEADAAGESPQCR